MSDVNKARHHARKAVLALQQSKTNCGTYFEIGTIEIEADNLKETYDELGKALDALGVQRLRPEHCKHPPELKERIDSCSDRCGACGRVNAMVPTRSGAARKWVDADDPRIAAGSSLTRALIDSERARIAASR